MTTTNGETKKDENALANEQRPSTKDGTTPSTPEEEMVPVSEIAKRHSKLMKTIDTITKERDASKQNLDSLTKELNELRRREAEKEEEEARQKPDGLTELQKKRERDKEAQKIKEDREALERDKAEHAAQLAEAQEAKQEVTVWTVASELNVDPVILKERCTKYKLTTIEDISDYAKEHAASLTKQEKKETPKVHPNTREMGGSTNTDNLTPKEKIELGLNKLEKK